MDGWPWTLMSGLSGIVHAEKDKALFAFLDLDQFPSFLFLPETKWSCSPPSKNATVTLLGDDGETGLDVNSRNGSSRRLSASASLFDSFPTALRPGGALNRAPYTREV